MRRAFLALALLVAAAPGTADGVTVYRCTDDAGRVALRDTPCPANQRQQVREMARPTDPPRVPTVRAPAPASAAADAPPATRVVLVEPPRPLYQCTTPEGARYTAETPDGNPRWVPMWTLGYPLYGPRNPLGDRVGAPRPVPPGNGPGAPDLPPVIGIAYTPGTWVRDHCVRLPAAQACEILLDEKRELRREWFNAMPSRRAEVAAEERVLAARIARTCGV